MLFVQIISSGGYTVIFLPLCRPFSHGLHHLPLVSPAHAVWQHLLHRRVRHPAGPAGLHSSRGARGHFLVLRLRHREGDKHDRVTLFGLTADFYLSIFKVQCGELLNCDTFCCYILISVCSFVFLSARAHYEWTHLETNYLPLQKNLFVL